ncbi:hypothetical protein [Paenibacillus xylaniclasticus]|uniref:hypothetical protein n=1 Tax=Paenibacillus xylaniclasticus TaxID=588083 RepID=UPI0013E03C5A|nr:MULTISPECIES: hypothetical protein [Paenibacillus]GFN33115.1 hypothetical protein PCURB6_33750 [Paenibacillus curdlanolyticus]
MLKEAIAQLKQNPEMLRQFFGNNLAFEAVGPVQKRAMSEIFNDKTRKIDGPGWWYTA